MITEPLMFMAFSCMLALLVAAPFMGEFFSIMFGEEREENAKPSRNDVQETYIEENSTEINPNK